MSVNTYAGETPSYPLPPFLGVQSRGAPRREHQVSRKKIRAVRAYCYPQAIKSIRWRLHSMSNSRAAAEQ